MTTSRFINPPTARLSLSGDRKMDAKEEQDGDGQHRKNIVRLAIRNATGVDERVFAPGTFSGRAYGNEESRHTAPIVIPTLERIEEDDNTWAPARMHYAFLPAVFHAIQIDQATGEPLLTDQQGHYDEIVKYFYRLPFIFYLKDAKGTVDMLMESLNIPTDIKPKSALTAEESIGNAHRFSERAVLITREILAGVFRAIYRESGSKALVKGERLLTRNEATNLIAPIFGLNTVSEEIFLKISPMAAKAFPLNGQETAQAVLGNEEEAAKKLRRQGDRPDRYTRDVERHKFALYNRLNAILSNDGDSWEKLQMHLSTSPVVRDHLRYLPQEELLSILRQMLFVTEGYMGLRDAI